MSTKDLGFLEGAEVFTRGSKCGGDGKQISESPTKMLLYFGPVKHFCLFFIYGLDDFFAVVERLKVSKVFSEYKNLVINESKFRYEYANKSLSCLIRGHMDNPFKSIIFTLLPVNCTTCI